MRTRILTLAIVSGIAGGLAAVILKNIITAVASRAGDLIPGFYFFMIPFIGVLLVGFLQNQFFKTSHQWHGIGSIIDSIAHKSAIIPAVLTYSRMLLAGLTIGFGGSAGLEAPIVTTGSALGANIGRLFRLSHKYRTLLIACGAASGISAIFNAPITGVLFALEVLVPTFSTTLFIPILLAAASGNVIAHFLLESEAIIVVPVIGIMPQGDLIWVVLLAVLTGLGSLYYDYVHKVLTAWFEKLKHWFFRALVGGFLLGALIFLFPALFGEGYIALKSIFAGDAAKLASQSMFSNIFADESMLALFFLLLMLTKPLAATFTILGGGVGGNFAPSFVMGGFLGYGFYLAIKLIFPHIELDPVSFTLLGMAGLLSGVMHAPLTGIFIIAELSGGYALFIPLMIVSALSYFLKWHYDHTPVYLNTANYKDIMSSHFEALPLYQLKLASIIETDFTPVKEDDSLRQILQCLSKSKRNLFPVLNEKGEMAGVILLDDLRPVMFDSEQYESKSAKDFLHVPPAYIQWDDNITTILGKFEETGAWNLPVVKNWQYKGFVSKSRLYGAYREELRKSKDLF